MERSSAAETASDTRAETGNRPPGEIRESAVAWPNLGRLRLRDSGRTDGIAGQSPSPGFD